MLQFFRRFKIPKGIQIALLVQKLWRFLLNGWILPIGGASSGRVCACSLRSRLVKAPFWICLCVFGLASSALVRASYIFQNQIDLLDNSLDKLIMLHWNTISTDGGVLPTTRVVCLLNGKTDYFLGNCRRRRRTRGRRQIHQDWTCFMKCGPQLT